MATKRKRRAPGRRWSAEVTRRSDALDPESRVFTKSPRAIAAPPSRPAPRSPRRQGRGDPAAAVEPTFHLHRRGTGAERRAAREARAREGRAAAHAWPTGARRARDGEAEELVRNAPCAHARRRRAND